MRFSWNSLVMMVLSLALWICSDWIFGFFNKDFGNFVVAMN